MNRLMAMRVIAWLLTVSGVAFGLFTIVFGVIGPDQETHAVRNAVVASLLLIVTAPADRGTEVRAVAAANEERADDARNHASRKGKRMDDPDARIGRCPST